MRKLTMCGPGNFSPGTVLQTSSPTVKTRHQEIGAA
jgi:hypothetical protein